MKKRRKKEISAFLLGIIIGITGMWVMIFGVLDTAILPADSDEKIAALKKASMLMDYVEDSYYEDVSYEDMADGMYKGIVLSLEDPYSSYMTAEEYKTWKEDVSGVFEGIGISVKKDDGGFLIMKVYEDTPASEAGLEKGDLITKVNGKEYESISDLVSVIRGKKGTKVDITYERDDREYEKELERADISISSVEWKVLESEYGYIAINSFQQKTSNEFREAVEELEKEDVKGLVIDLRDNGGGLLDEGIKVADELLSEGDIMTYVYKNGKTKKVHADENSTDLPYVILVNGQTASASEMVTAAVKDNEGGEIIGSRTYGKGIIQATGSLNDGTAIKLTVEEYRSPKGHKIHKKGIEPDYKVSKGKDDNRDRQIEKALEILKDKI